MNKQTNILEILKRLKKAYGSPKPYKATDPVNELIRTVLSQNTNDKNSLAAFAILKKNFRRWDTVLTADARHIAGLIKHAGLANIKARRIKALLSEIKRREGRLSLKRIAGMQPAEALAYLTSLGGVGPKTASCVLLFSFGMPVMPVDTHIFRVSKRLGLIGEKVSIEDAHELLTKMSSFGPKKTDLIYNLHLCIIEHGRRTCRSQNPRCGFCVLFNMCRFKDKIKFREAK